MLVLSYVRLSICMKKSQNHICAFIRTIKVTCSDIKFDTYITGTPPPSKKKTTVETYMEYEAEKRKRSFQSNWLNKFTWLEHKTDKMYCKVCLSFLQFSNSQ